jgi:hypothetical protein
MPLLLWRTCSRVTNTPITRPRAHAVNAHLMQTQLGWWAVHLKQECTSNITSPGLQVHCAPSASRNKHNASTTSRCWAVHLPPNAPNARRQLDMRPWPYQQTGMAYRQTGQLHCLQGRPTAQTSPPNALNRRISHGMRPKNSLHRWVPTLQGNAVPAKHTRCITGCA